MPDIFDEIAAEEAQPRDIFDGIADEKTGIPVLRAAPPVEDTQPFAPEYPEGFIDGLKDYFGNDWGDKSTEAVQALVDADLIRKRTGQYVSPYAVSQFPKMANRALSDNQTDRDVAMSFIKRAQGGWEEDDWTTSTLKGFKAVPYSLQVAAGGVLQAISESGAGEFYAALGEGYRLNSLYGLPPLEQVEVINRASDIAEKEEVLGLGQFGRGIAKKVVEAQAALAPDVEPWSWKYYANAATTSTANNLAYLLPAIVAKNPNLALTAMGIQTFGTKYQEQREGGSTLLTATMASLVSGGAEVAGEFVSVGIYFKPNLSLALRLVKVQFPEIVGEEATTIALTIVDKVTIKPEMTLQDVMQEMTDTAYVTVFSTIGLSGGSHAINKLMAKELPPDAKSAYDGAAKDTIQAGGTAQEAVSNGIRAARGTESGKTTIEAITKQVERSANIEYATALLEEAGLNEAQARESIKALSENPELIGTEATQALPAETQDELTRIFKQSAYIDSSDKVARTVKEHLITTGVTEENAGAQSALYGAFFRVMGDRVGQDPYALFAGYGLTIATGAEGQAARGQIAFTPKGVNITLFEKADQTTFLHETGHFFSHILNDVSSKPNAPADIIKDNDIIRKWVEAKEGKPFTTKQTEQFARGFEKYLMKGESPSAELRGVFARFSQWLTEVYKSLKALRVKLTPEVEAVMDRLLASQEDISEGQKEVIEAMIDMVAEGRELENITENEIIAAVPAYKGLKGAQIQAQINSATGLNASIKLIREDKALNASWASAKKTARKALEQLRTEKGKADWLLAEKDFILRSEIAKSKQKLRDVMAAARDKVKAIQTEKQMMASRRSQIAAIIDHLGLTQTDAQKLMGKRHVALMGQWEYKQFKDNLLVKAVEIQKNKFEKARVMQAIETLHLANHEAYRRSLDLPSLKNMTTEQSARYADLLETFEDGDVFLTERELETVDRTDLEGIRTWGEALDRLAKETGVSVDALKAIKVSWTDKFKWDATLAQANPFYKLLVNETHRKLLIAEARTMEVQNDVRKLLKKAHASRERTVWEKVMSLDEVIVEYLETPDAERADVVSRMTKEEIDLANYMQAYFRKALDYLIRVGALDRGREDYYTHIRRSFFEAFGEDGFSVALKEMFRSQELDAQTFGILDGDTGNILPLDKFFRFSVRRVGGMEPSKNAAKAFFAYVSTFEKKQALDELLPKLDIYAQSLTPAKYTERGLDVDRTMKKFVYQWVNNKKGRNIDMGFVKQGDKLDISIRALRTFTTMMDLGFNIPLGAVAWAGERSANFFMLGTGKFLLGEKRRHTKKGKEILKKHENFTGRSVWEEFAAPEKMVFDHISTSMFAFLHQASVNANKQFLLASLTQEEWDSKTIDPKRLTEMQLEMGRWRVIPGTRSLVGSTSLGAIATQHKSWAIPMASATVSDIKVLVGDLRSKPLGEALTTREARELYRVIALTLPIVMLIGAGDEKDKTFIGQLCYKLRRDALSVLQAIDPQLWLGVPRAIAFLKLLGDNLHSLITLERYKEKRGLKGAEGLKRQFTPAVVKQFVPQKKKEEARP